MTFNEYQKEAYKTAIPTTKNFTYMVCGLANEAGEVAGKFKKLVRGDTSTSQFKKELAKELGDVLWYISGVAKIAKLELDQIAIGNIKKLHDRQLRGKIKGNGDDR
jgi:NTP pyrophosphatase (non-canonical NTP hydrolase)